MKKGGDPAKLDINGHMDGHVDRQAQIQMRIFSRACLNEPCSCRDTVVATD